MRRYLSKFEFTLQLIESAIYDCLNGVGNSNSRWKRMDSAYFLAEYLNTFLEIRIKTNMILQEKFMTT